MDYWLLKAVFHAWSGARFRSLWEVERFHSLPVGRHFVAAIPDGWRGIPAHFIPWPPPPPSLELRAAYAEEESQEERD